MNNRTCPCVCHDGNGAAHPNEACWCKGGRQNRWTHPLGEFYGKVSRPKPPRNVAKRA